MNLRALTLATGLVVTSAETSTANIVGSTYDFFVSAIGATEIEAVDGTYTDPANPGFCVGPPVACSEGFGLSGSFSFADVTPTMSTITFQFFGTGGGMGPGEFSINLSNFMGGDTITDVTYASGNLQEGDFTNVTWEGTSATFTGSSGIGYAATDGASVVFNVTTTAEPDDLGDYNQDGVVDAADYAVWRKGLSVGDYPTWRAHFGESLSAVGNAAGVVPESGPLSCAVISLGILALLRARTTPLPQLR
jgi:hypothetical protein